MPLLVYLSSSIRNKLREAQKEGRTDSVPVPDSEG